MLSVLSLMHLNDNTVWFSMRQIKKDQLYLLTGVTIFLRGKCFITVRTEWSVSRSIGLAPRIESSYVTLEKDMLYSRQEDMGYEKQHVFCNFCIYMNSCSEQDE